MPLLSAVVAFIEFLERLPAYWVKAVGSGPVMPNQSAV
jgi:hypothetical protein